MSRFKKKRVNYYPFGLKQKGYNSAVTGRSHQYKYNNTELEEGLGLNWYEMPLRSYDPTTARWNRIDPVVHHGLSTYNAFDNNPIYYADPSGGNSHRGGHGARMQILRASYYGSELSNLDWVVGRLSDHPPEKDNNNNSGTRITATNYGTNLSAAIASLQADEGEDTDPWAQYFGSEANRVGEEFGVGPVKNTGGDGSGSFMDYFGKFVYWTDQFNPIALIWDGVQAKITGTDRYNNELSGFESSMKIVSAIPRQNCQAWSLMQGLKQLCHLELEQLSLKGVAKPQLFQIIILQMVGH